jgi:ubiquinone/menaquinone biosynthesis C-methylase UbiE
MKADIKQVYNNLGEHYYNVRKGKEKGHSYFYNNLLEMPTTLKLLGSVRGKKILDLGCGPGIYTRILVDKGADVKGIDFSEKEIEIARKEVPEAQFMVGNIETLPYKDSEFDIVLSTLVIEHLKSWDKTLRQIKRVLKKDGIFVFSIHNPVIFCVEKDKWFFRTFRIIKNYFKED